MAGDFLILTESCCELPPERVAVPLTEVVPLTLTVAGRNYQHFLDNRELSPKAFFDMLRRKETASTAAPSMSEFIRRAEPHLRKGLDVLHIGIASALSATFATGAMALRELKAQYPLRDIVSIDSICGSLGEGLLVEMAIEARKMGMSLKETAAKLEENKRGIIHAFTVDDLQHLHRGGRLSGYAALLGSLLQFKPIVCLNEEGRLNAVSRVRGMRKAVSALHELVMGKLKDPQSRVYVAHGDSPERADELARLLRRSGAADVSVQMLGPVIGAHGGPGALAVFFRGSKR